LLLLDPGPRFFLQSEPIQQKDGKMQPLGLVALIALYTMGKPVLASGRWMKLEWAVLAGAARIAGAIGITNRWQMQVVSQGVYCA
jgi:hypothetical protein